MSGIHSARSALAGLAVTGMVAGGAVALRSTSNPPPPAPVADTSAASPDPAGQVVQDLIDRSNAVHAALGQAQAELRERNSASAASPTAAAASPSSPDGPAAGAGPAAPPPAAPAAAPAPASQPSAQPTQGGEHEDHQSGEHRHGPDEGSDD